jgi:hypothetical protein
VRILTGDVALTLRANLRAKWLRRVPVFLGLVRFFGLPMTAYLRLVPLPVLYQIFTPF